VGGESTREDGEERSIARGQEEDMCDKSVGLGERRVLKRRLWAHRRVNNTLFGAHRTVCIEAEQVEPSWSTGQFTVQCPVHIGLSGEPRLREF
jgi:hypothetical protein